MSFATIHKCPFCEKSSEFVEIMNNSGECPNCGERLLYDGTVYSDKDKIREIREENESSE